jgi:drug/metabolite transporter (DMT)-like permease
MPDIKLSLLILANGFFGLSFGVFLLLKALETGNVAEVTILSATSPVMILPFIWYKTGRCPAWGAWLGALLVVASTTLL